MSGHALRRPHRRTRQHQALHACLDVLLRMIPDYCKEQRAQELYTHEHDAAIAEAAAVLYGKSPSRWPKGVRAAAAGRYP